MFRALFVLLAVGTVGCAPMMYGPGRTAPVYGLFGPPARPMAAIDSSPASVVGRWDNVVGLNPTAQVGIVLADGSHRTGRFLRAGMDFVRILENGIEIDLSRDDVARLDLLKNGAGIDGAEIARDAAVGAAVSGAMLMVVPYLITGRVEVPPARWWAAGAVAGGAGSYEQQRFAHAARTLYVSPDLVVAR